MSREFIDFRISPEETLIIKAFAVILMLLHHVLLEHLDYGPVAQGLAGTSKVCVALFVFLSGYGMTVSFPKNRDNFLDLAKTYFFFLTKRFTKFFLNYWAIFFIVVPLGVFCFGRSLETAYGANADLFASFLRDMFGLQSFESYNTSWWFNKIILALWLLFPLFYRIMKNGLVAGCVFIFIFINPGDILYSFELVAKCLSMYVSLFCLGIFTALHSSEINKILNTIPIRLALLTSLLMATAFLYLRGVPLIPNFSFFRVDPFATAFTILLIVVLCRLTGLKLSFLRYTGRHSMNIYLVHMFILGYFGGEYISKLQSPIVIFIVLFFASLAISIVFEWVKNKLGFYKLQNKIVSFLSRQIPSVNN